MKILVVGCGSIGRRHAENMAKLAETAVVDANTELAQAVARQTDIQTFSDLASGLAWKPDGVIVAVPTHLHLPIADAAIRAGADVLIEKPISHSSEEVNAFLERSENLGQKVFVVCNMRFHPAIAVLHENISRIAKPLYARVHFGNYLPNMRPNADYRTLYCANRSQGGGVILDAIHEIDYLMWFFGPARDVQCMADKLSDLSIDVEDFACISLRHESGVISELQMDYLRPFKRRGCEIVGDAGMLLWESEGKQPEKCLVRLFDKKTEEWETLLATEKLDMNAGYVALVKMFLAAIEGINHNLLTGHFAAQELEVALKALDLAKAKTC